MRPSPEQFRPNETALLETIRSWGWLAEEWGQQVLNNTVRNWLQWQDPPDPPCFARWHVDIIARRGDGLAFNFFLDAKECSDRNDYLVNHDAARAAAWFSRGGHFTCFIFNDGKLITADEAVSGRYVNPSSRPVNGTGQPFHAIPKKHGKPAREFMEYVVKCVARKVKVDDAVRSFNEWQKGQQTFIFK